MKPTPAYPQPEPVRSVKITDPIVDTVIDNFIVRATFGKEKYGVGLEREDLSFLEFANHLQEELMDGILYLEKLKSMLQTLPKLK
jgi:hypothetical protein